MAVGLHNLTGKNIIPKPNTVIAKISAANVVPHMLVPKNPIDAKSMQAAAHSSELCNATQVSTCSDDIE